MCISFANYPPFGRGGVRERGRYSGGSIFMGHCGYEIVCLDNEQIPHQIQNAEDPNTYTTKSV